MLEFGGKSVAEQNEAYSSTVLSMKMEVFVITAALMWLAGTKVNKEIIVYESQSALHKDKEEQKQHVWVQALFFNKNVIGYTAQVILEYKAMSEQTCWI